MNGTGVQEMRLIDADELIKGRIENDLVRIVVKCAPTAFDKEKVIEELRSEESRWHESGVEFKDENEKGVAAGFRLATHIVEKGGI